MNDADEESLAESKQPEEEEDEKKSRKELEIEGTEENQIQAERVFRILLRVLRLQKK